MNVPQADPVTINSNLIDLIQAATQLTVEIDLVIESWKLTLFATVNSLTLTGSPTGYVSFYDTSTDPWTLLGTSPVTQ